MPSPDPRAPTAKADGRPASSPAPPSPSARPSPARSADSRALESIEYMSEVLVLLDHYDDIFSDFDPRPYSEREISEDLLKELQRRHLTTRRGGLEVRFLVPAQGRDTRVEATIRRRLREHFAQGLDEMDERLAQRRRRGILYVGVGVALLGLELASALQTSDALWPRLTGLLLVPAGWFFAWNGFERVFEDPESLARARGMYDKMSKCSFIFVQREGHRTQEPPPAKSEKPLAPPAA